MKEKALFVLRAIAGGLAICFGTLASKMCPYPEIAPLLFSVGIFLVMELDLGLITRFFPTFGLNRPVGALVVLLSNLFIAYLCGLSFNLPLTIPDNLFLMSIGGGAMIGLVSLVNIYGQKYRLSIMLMIMYIFVMLGMPHCVVYAFLNVDIITLITVVIGNLVGGLLIGLIVHYSQNKKFLE